MKADRIKMLLFPLIGFPFAGFAGGCAAFIKVFGLRFILLHLLHT